MQTQTATVVAVSGNKLTVSVDEPVACARCAQGKGCGAGALGASRGPSLLELDSPEHAVLREGDTVRLTMHSGDLLRASWLAYGLPMTCVVAALGLLRLLRPESSDIFAVTTAGLVFIASFVAARAWLRRDLCMQRLTPRISPAGGGA